MTAPKPGGGAAAAARAAAAGPRTVLITGVSRGLGRALALELARRGHAVVGCGRSVKHLRSLEAEITSPSRHFLTVADVRSDSSMAELAKAVVEKKQVPVNNAGTINKNNKTWNVPVEDFDMVVDTNIKGTANVLRHFIPLMIAKRHGIIINLSSGWGRSAAAEVAPYCASKWAIEGLTRSLAKELPPGIAAIALSPGVVNTDMLTSCFGSSAALYQTTETWDRSRKKGRLLKFHYLGETAQTMVFSHLYEIDLRYHLSLHWCECGHHGWWIPQEGGNGKERKDVMSKNVSIYKAQASTLEAHAAPNCKVLVVANPANTNALILKIILSIYS